MPNYCDYAMLVKGYPSNVGKFIEIMRADYSYSPQSYFRTHPHKHMYRIFEAELNDTMCEMMGMVMQVELVGYCAWSVHSCMMPGPFSYYNDYNVKNIYNCNMFDDLDYYLINGQRYGTHLLNLAKELNLYIEAYSDEPGMCFQEHYIIDNFGRLLVEEEAQTMGFYLEDYDNYKDFIKDYKDHKEIFTEEMFNNAKQQGLAYKQIGGFEPDGIAWDYKIYGNVGKMVKIVNKDGRYVSPRMCHIVNKEENKNG